MKEFSVHISLKSFITVTLFVVGIYLIFLLWHTLLLVFVALIFSTLIEPFARALQKRRIPRAIAAVLVYVLLFGILGISVGVLAPVVARDLPQVFENMGQAVSSVKNHPLVMQLLGSNFLTNQSFLLPSTGSDTGNFFHVFSGLGAVFGGIVSFVIVLVITFYLVIEEDPLRKVFSSIMPEKNLPFILSVVDKIREKLGLWMRGQLLLSGIVGILVFFVLSVLGIKYAAVIALLAAVFEMVPYVGPLLAVIPALFFAFHQGGFVLIALVAVSFIIIQQFENHILIPKVMQKAVGLNPIISIIALLIGLQLGGILGGVLAIPVATAFQVIIEEIGKLRTEEGSK